MREGGRAGAGLIYPRVEAIRLASRPTTAWGEALSSLEALKGGRICECGEALPRTLRGQSPSDFSGLLVVRQSDRQRLCLPPGEATSGTSP